MSEKKYKNFLAYLSRKKRVVVYSVLLFLIFGLLITFVKPLEYSSTVSVLIIQKINPNLDAYTAARAAEKLGNNLAEIIHTTSFFDKVRYSNFALKIDWPESEQQKRKTWQNKVEAKMIGETSILEITAYDQDKQEAEKLAQAIVYVLTSEGDEYHGGGEDIIIKPVDTALTSDYPTRPNIILNIIASLFIGLVGGCLIVYWSYFRETY